LSRFAFSIEYFPVKDKIMTHAMPRFAYPLTSAKQDITQHGSAMAINDAEKRIFREFAEGRQLGPFAHFVFHANLTPEKGAKADKERADKSEKRHAYSRAARGGRRGLIEGGGEPELPYVAPMWTTMDTTNSMIGGGSTPGGEPDFTSVIPMGQLLTPRVHNWGVYPWVAIIEF